MGEQEGLEHMTEKRERERERESGWTMGLVTYLLVFNAQPNNWLSRANGWVGRGRGVRGKVYKTVIVRMQISV